MTVREAGQRHRGTGGAIEHTNLGTIKSTDIGKNLNRVTIAADELEPKLAGLFNGFDSQIQSKFQVAT